MLRLVPGAERERGKSEVRPRQVLGRAQRIHARVGAPRSLASTPSAIDDARVAHAVAHQGKGCSLPAQSTADDEHVEHRSAVRPRSGGHPVGGRKVHARQIVPRLGSQLFVS